MRDTRAASAACATVGVTPSCSIAWAASTIAARVRRFWFTRPVSGTFPLTWDCHPFMVLKYHDGRQHPEGGMDHAAMDQIVNEHFGYEAADDVDGVLATLAPGATHHLVGSPLGPAERPGRDPGVLRGAVRRL